MAAVYLPDLGRGFLRDDFAWIESSRAAWSHPLGIVLPDRPGFYRPIVSLSFAVDYAVHGLSPRGYGFTNLLLLIGCAAALYQLCRRVGLGTIGAAVAVLAWTANPHGINMALVWISGRTALWLTLFALLANLAASGRCYATAAVFLFGALLSKEEALALPGILLVWNELVFAPSDRRDRLRLAAALVVPVVAYLFARAHTAAYTPASAPPYYQFTFAPAAVIVNAFSYLDRGATLAAALTVLAAMLMRLRPTLTVENRRLAAAGAAWFAIGIAMSVFLPVRSSLYVVFPSIGTAIVCGVLVESIHRRATVLGRRGLVLEPALAAALLIAIPIYQQRNDRWVEPARLSQRALTVIANGTALLPNRGAIVLRDAGETSSSFAGAFGTLATDAVRLHTGRDLQVWIDPPPPEFRVAGLMPPDRQSVVAYFAVEKGRVFRVDE